MKKYSILKVIALALSGLLLTYTFIALYLSSVAQSMYSTLFFGFSSVLAAIFVATIAKL
jgi:hypothetical protein